MEMSAEKFMQEGSFTAMSWEAKNRMKYFSCMRIPDCGGSVWTAGTDGGRDNWHIASILPDQLNPSGEFVYFTYLTICNYELQFDTEKHCPGDEIKIKMDRLTNTRVLIAVGEK